MSSAELEMTVNMLIQIDKLVQLLESPVFTCMPTFSAATDDADSSRSTFTTSGTREVSTSLQMPIRCSYATSTIIRICSVEESPE